MSDEVLGSEQIMANSKSKNLQVLMTDIRGKAVASTLPYFMESALPYVILEDRGQDVNVGNWAGLVRVGHTSDLPHWESRLVQDVVHKSLQKKQRFVHEDKAGKYATIDLIVWRDACHGLDEARCLKRACAPLLGCMWHVCRMGLARVSGTNVCVPLWL